MTSDRYLELEDVVAMVRALGVGPIRDVGLLDSAVARPRASAFGEDAYPTLSLKAAALLHSMTKNHALINGNKRLAWLATVVFCDLNGLTPLLSNDEAFRLVLDVANSAIDDVSLIASRLKLTQHDSQTHSSRPT